MDKNKLIETLAEVSEIIGKAKMNDEYRSSAFSEVLRYFLSNNPHDQTMPEQKVEIAGSAKTDVVLAKGRDGLIKDLNIDPDSLDEIVDFTDNEITVTIGIPDGWPARKRRQYFSHIFLTLKSYLKEENSAPLKELKEKLQNYGITDEKRQLSVELRGYNPYITVRKTQEGIFAVLTTRGRQEGLKLIKELRPVNS